MQPENTRTKLRKAAVSRGRLYLKSHLGFLPGFPVRQEGTTVVWMPAQTSRPGAGGLVQITPETLRRANFGWNTLQRRFPNAFPEIVGDADNWRRVLPTLLEVLGRAVHEGSPLPASLFRSEYGFSPTVKQHAARIVRKAPRLSPLVDTLSWVLCLNPAEASSALSWLEADPQRIGNLAENLPGTEGTMAVMALWNLTHRLGQPRTAPLLATLGVRQCFSIPTFAGDYLADLEQCLPLKNGSLRSLPESLPARPPAEWASAVLALMHWLRDQPAKTARVALELFACAFPDDWLVGWQAWWHTMDPEIATVRQMLSRVRAQPEQQFRFVRETQAIAERLSTIVSRKPPLIRCRRRNSNPTGLLAAIRRLAQPECRTFHTPLFRLLQEVDQVGAKTLPRAGILCSADAWLDLEWIDGESLKGNLHARVQDVLRALCDARIPPAQLERVIDDDSFSGLFSDDANPRRECEAIAHWVGHLQQRKHIGAPIAVCRSFSREEEMYAALQELVGIGSIKPKVSAGTVQCAVQLAPAGNLLALVRALHKTAQKESGVEEDLLLVAEQLACSGWTSVVSEAVCEGDAKHLSTLAQQLRLAQQLGVAVKPTPYPQTIEIQAWALRYPTQLHASLAEFGAVVPEAEERAASLLGGMFREADEIHREIQTIESRLAEDPSQERLAKRLANLCNRLKSPLEISAASVARLDRRLRRAVRRQVIGDWHQMLREGIRQVVLSRLGVDEYPEWLREPRHERVLAGVLELDGWARELGLRLLRMRCGPPPWHLNDEEPNQRFIAHLRSLGVDPEPWLDPQPAVTHTDRTGRQVHVAMEHDPLEILQMGAYFQTCLSPGGCNFFSAVANAADVNKGVIFARDDRGRVLGRCLLAITENGGLLAFRDYYHDSGLDFRSERFAEDLAQRMGTVVIKRGKVPTLVAGNWYDDGAMDVCSRIPCLEDDSELCKALPEVDLRAVISTIEAALAPLSINSLTLPLLLNLYEFRERPELVRPLLPRIEDTENLDIDTILIAAELAYQTGAERDASRILRLRAVPLIVRTHRQCNWLNETALGRMTAIDPTVSLRAIRSTRPRGVKKDEQETYPNRRQLLAEAHAALGRTSRAKKLTAET